MVLIAGNTPWTLAPLDGKYYGTKLLDVKGREMISIWGSAKEPDDHRPSPREIERFGPDFSEECWAEYCCDTHYETKGDYLLALSILDNVNGQVVSDEQADDELPDVDEGVLKEFVDRVEARLSQEVVMGAWQHNPQKRTELISKRDRFLEIATFLKNHVELACAD